MLLNKRISIWYFINEIRKKIILIVFCYLYWSVRPATKIKKFPFLYAFRLLLARLFHC